MQRLGMNILSALGLGLLAVVLADIVINALGDPLADRRAELRERLAQVPNSIQVPDPEGWQFDKWQESLARKPGLWDALVPLPPEPPPAPPPPPKPPDLKEILKGVRPTRQQIGGKKLKLITPEDPKGVWVAVGEQVKGCTLQSFDKERVTFALFWTQGNKEITYSIPRD